MSNIDVRVMRLAHGKDLPLPSYQSVHAAGLDLLAAVPATAPLTIAPRDRALVPPGLPSHCLKIMKARSAHVPVLLLVTG